MKELQECSKFYPQYLLSLACPHSWWDRAPKLASNRKGNASLYSGLDSCSPAVPGDQRASSTLLSLTLRSEHGILRVSSCVLRVDEMAKQREAQSIRKNG